MHKSYKLLNIKDNKLLISNPTNYKHYIDYLHRIFQIKQIIYSIINDQQNQVINRMEIFIASIQIPQNTNRNQVIAMHQHFRAGLWRGGGSHTHSNNCNTNINNSNNDIINISLINMLQTNTSKADNSQANIHKCFKKRKDKTQTKIEDTILTNQKHWNINTWIIIDDSSRCIKMMADTGATISAINADLARYKYEQHIQKLKRAEKAITAGHKELNLTQFIELKFINPYTNQILTTMNFYLIENLNVDYLASCYLLRCLGYKFPSMPPKYKSIEKMPEPDTNFGSCNNWDEPRIKVPEQTPKTPHNSPKAQPKHTETIKYLQTPYKQIITQCRKGIINIPNPIQAVTYAAANNITIPIPDYTDKYDPLNTLLTLHNEITTKTNKVNHISNFNASDSELQRVKQLTKDRPLKSVPLQHLKVDKYLHNKTYTLVNNTYKDIFAKHQSHRRVIPKWEFKIDLIDEAKGQVIFKPQYPLNEEKRLVYIHHTKLNIKNGVFVPNKTSPHNVPAIIIKRKDGRLRLAFDFTKLNAKTKSVQSNIPTYNYLFELMRHRGKYSTTDAKNFFEGINLRQSDQDLCHVTTPIGEYNITCGTYGFKNIAAMA